MQKRNHCFFKYWFKSCRMQFPVKILFPQHQYLVTAVIQFLDNSVKNRFIIVSEDNVLFRYPL